MSALCEVILASSAYEMLVSREDKGPFKSLCFSTVTLRIGNALMELTESSKDLDSVNSPNLMPQYAL